ncbi:hypothetical protein ACFSKU_16415 [Pontibacter silvestris]|uniref:Uncharacterized protein n=1 Tax=Pontibacter silvestris TaxID=2305183 RepID=A0ABW4X1M2_9BACT|nr:hypothetical protein [Pontibacter silvestris]MCC9136056.1 hypothetical protein [Pontibacter silvestris]
MEEAQNKRDKDSILQLYNKVLPALAEHINQNLTEVIPLFHDYLLERLVDTWTKSPDASNETPISIENGNVQQMGLRLRLEGFQRAGVPPFDVTKDLLFKLMLTTYEVGPNKNNVWAEKQYYEAWTPRETEDIAQKWSEELIGEIMQRLESLT